MIPDWARRYVGIPWKDSGRDALGSDCFGLVRLVLLEQFRVDLPSYVGAYVSAHEREEVSSLIAGHVATDGCWMPVAMPRAGDGIVLRILNRPWHVGLMVSPHAFLHVQETQGYSTIERLDDSRWARRIVGFYRHRALG
jgi:cell wall-associated NlpC family hydrolase